MTYYKKFEDTEPLPWVDARRQDIPYKYRFDIEPSKDNWLSIKDKAATLQATVRYTSECKREDRAPLTADTVNTSRKGAPKRNIVDYLGGFLGFRVTRFRPGLGRTGGPNPFTTVIHGCRDWDITVEDTLRMPMVEFMVAHEMGHYILHTSGGRVPSCWPRQSSSLHDAEATVFGGWWALPDSQMESIGKLVGYSVRDAAYLISEIFHWCRYIPDIGIPVKAKKPRKQRKSKSKSILTARQKAVKALGNIKKFEDD
jgi:hypothetical protein